MVTTSAASFLFTPKDGSQKRSLGCHSQKATSQEISSSSCSDPCRQLLLCYISAMQVDTPPVLPPFPFQGWRLSNPLHPSHLFRQPRATIKWPPFLMKNISTAAGFQEVAGWATKGCELSECNSNSPCHGTVARQKGLFRHSIESNRLLFAPRRFLLVTKSKNWWGEARRGHYVGDQHSGVKRRRARL